MRNLPNKALPTNPRRILLINPTKYLGNLLLAGGLIQDFAAQCREEQRELLLVLDMGFQDLLREATRGINVLWYPRQAMRRSGAIGQLRAFLGVLAQMRRFNADLAFNIEEDSLSSRLTQLSGAAFKLGCSSARHRRAYDHVLVIDYGAQHRWHSYHAVFRAAGLESPDRPGYIKLYLQADASLTKKLHELGIEPGTALVAIHPAATKEYKQWPESAFINLCNILTEKGYSPLILGSGRTEWERCERIRQQTARAGSAQAHNLCDKLSLAELASLFRVCCGIVGNDSGPSHLASAQGLPGVVVFGPSDPALWSPLGTRTTVLRKAELCDPGCSRRSCLAGFRCLQAIRPEDVYEALEKQMDNGVAA